MSHAYLRVYYILGQALWLSSNMLATDNVFCIIWNDRANDLRCQKQKDLRCNKSIEP